jgi:WD40 repeat protein
VPFTDALVMDLSDDGKVLALSGGVLSDARIALFDTSTRQAIATVDVEFLQRGGPQDRDFDLSPDGSRMLLVDDEHVTVVDPATDARHVLALAPSRGEAATALDAVFADDSRTIIVRHLDGTFSAWDAETFERDDIPLPEHSNTGPIGMSRQGILSFAEALPDHVEMALWDVHAGAEVRRVRLEAPPNWPGVFALADDLSVLVGAGSDFDPILVWDATTGDLIPSPNAPAGRTLTVDPTDPSLVIVGSGSGTLTTYDVRSGQPVGAPLHGQGPGIRSLAGAPGGGLMATVADDGVITLWGDNQADGLLDTELGGDVNQALFGGDTLVVLSRNHRRAEIRRADQPGAVGIRITKPAWADSYVYSVAHPSANGSVVAVLAVQDGNLETTWTAVIDAGTGAAVWTHHEDDFVAFEVAISDDGTLVAVVDLGHDLIRVFDVGSGERRAEIEVPEIVSGAMVFTADASHLDVDTHQGLRRYDVSGANAPVAAEQSLYAQGRIAQVPGTDEVIGFGGLGQGLARWNMASGQRVATSPSQDGSNLADVAVSPDGRYVAAYHFFTGNISIYDLATLDELGLIPAGSGVNPTISFTPDGRLVADGLFGEARVWDLDPEHWAQIACHAAGRNLTREEWERYLGADEPYRATCEEWAVV